MKEFLKKIKHQTFLVFNLLLASLVMISHESVAQCPSCGVGLNAAGVSAECVEYDNMTSGFHQTIAKTSTGEFEVWGELMGATSNTHVLSPQTVNATNYPGLTGTVLKATIGSYSSAQAAVLTTTGIFAWGTEGTLFSPSVKASSTFGPITVTGGSPTGLPLGVNPTDVKMFFGTYHALVITTNSGSVYTLVYNNPELQGDGSTTANSTSWTQVKISASQVLSGVIAARGGPNGLIALTNTGQLYTWGKKTYLGNGTAINTYSYATLMTLPAGETPKMIGSSEETSSNSTSHYLVSTTNKLYALGSNASRQLGDFTNTERTTWVQSLKSISPYVPFNDVAYISPNEHDNAGRVSINVITTDGQIYAFGFTDSGMHGVIQASFVVAMDPQKPLNILTTDVVTLVETGGHTSVLVKNGSAKYCYTGHKINGSMGDGSGSADIYNYDCTNTPTLSIACATCTITSTPTLSGNTAQNDCQNNTTANINNLVTSTTPLNTTLGWFTNINHTGTAYATPTDAAAGTYYAFYYDAANSCYGPASAPVTVTITSCIPPLSASTPAAQTATTGQAKTGNAATELAPTGGTAPYIYSNGAGDAACVAPSGATALPAGSNLTVTNSTGAYTYTAPSAAGTYYYCIKLCDSATPTPSCVVKTYTLTVSAPVTISNTCPTATVNLTTAISATNLPSGATVTWHTGTPATTANKVTDPTAVSTSGNYYMAYFDGTNNCYSETSQAVTVTITPCLSASNPAAQTATPSQAKTGNAATELAPTGGTAPYTYSNGAGDVACVAPSGATALPAGSNLTVNSSTGAYTYTAPSTAGTYYFCIKICDNTTPTAQCVVKTYTVTVTAACNAGTAAPILIKN